MAGLGNAAAIEGDLLDRAYELARPALFQDAQAVARRLHLEPACGEGAGEEEAAGVLGDVDEPPCSGEAAAETAHIHVSGFIDLGHAEAGKIETAMLQPS